MELIGSKFGEWTVLAFHHKERGGAYWLCQCSCGKIKPVAQTSLVLGKSCSCGCKRKSH